jgi:hypothetical protein
MIKLPARIKKASPDVTMLFNNNKLMLAGLHVRQRDLAVHHKYCISVVANPAVHLYDPAFAVINQLFYAQLPCYVIKLPAIIKS